jgi:hypothetical protein
MRSIWAVSANVVSDVRCSKKHHGWAIKMERKMPRDIRDEERLTEDEIARRKLGPRGVPGGPDTSKMTPQQKENIPTGEFDGHTA